MTFVSKHVYTYAIQLVAISVQAINYFTLFTGRLTMSEIEMIKEELQVKSQQLDEKEQETILLKAEIKRVEEKLTLTTNYLEEIINRLII